MRYELTFDGRACQDGEKFPRYERYHKTLESARAEALRIRAELEASHHGMSGHTTTGSHHPQIYGPDGHVDTVAW